MKILIIIQNINNNNVKQQILYVTKTFTIYNYNKRNSPYISGTTQKSKLISNTTYSGAKKCLYYSIRSN